MEQKIMHGGSGYWGLFRNPRDVSFCSAWFPHTHPLPPHCFSQHHFSQVSVSLCTGKWLLAREDGQKAQSGDAVPLLTGTSLRWERSLVAARLSARPPALVTRQWSDLQGLLQLPGSFLQSWSSPPPFAAPRFPHPNSQCAEGNAWSAPDWWFCLTSCY